MREGISAKINTGTYVSGIGHAGVFLWLMIGGLFVARDDLPEISVTDVSIISADDFEAIRPQSPETGDAPPAPEAPSNDDSAPALSVPDTQPAPRPEAPQILPQAVPDQSQDIPDDTAEPVVEPQPEVEVLGDEGGVTVAPEDNPAPQAAPVITDQATEAPKEDVAVDDTAQSETAPAPDATVVEEANEETAPEQTTTEIVTEAEEQPSTAPTKSLRPGRKPKPPAPEVAQTPAVPGLQDVINETVNEVTANSENAAENNANSGGGTSSPITREEKGAFIIGIQKCWNVGALGTDALRVSVVVAFTMDRDGKPQGSSIRMIGAEGGTGDAVKRAYETARRAIIRCGAKGYGLPIDKYDQWQEVEVTFNATRKQIR
jgi:hypothetical protein